MIEQINFRRYENKDKDDVFSLHQRALLATSSFILSGDIDRDLEDIYGHYLNNHGDYLIAEYGGKIIGMAALRRIDEQTAELKRMRVDPNFQGRGIGTELLQRMEQRAKELGYQKIILDVTPNQKAAKQLYETHGYQFDKSAPFMGLEVLYYQKDL